MHLVRGEKGRLRRQTRRRDRWLALCAVASVWIGAHGALAAQESDVPPRVDEVVVVVASGVEQLLLDAPASITVLGPDDVALAPTSLDFADLLRRVPGLNVTELAAGDVNMQARANAGNTAAGQLTLVDGRSVYLDFLNITLWRWMPIDFAEIERVEVQRGPGSAVWGGNAFRGVTNFVTKSPRQLGPGLRVKVGGGERGTGYGSLTYAGVGDRLAGRLSAGYSVQDPWDRPPPLASGVRRDIYPNPGVSSPRLDARIDIGTNARRRWSLSGGYAGGGGILHTSIGPFAIDPGSAFGYARVDYERDALQARAYVNFLHADSTNLLLGLPNRTDTDTYDVSVTDTSSVGEARVTYGANARFLSFDMDLAPAEHRRTELGGFAHVEWPLSDRTNLHAGLRADKYSNLASPVLSPRLALLFRLGANGEHALRAGYSRSFMVASLLHNYLDTTFFNPIELPGAGRYLLPTDAVGNRDLKQATLDQVEVGYRGSADRGRWSWDLSAWWIWENDRWLFEPVAFYTSADPPPDWPLPPQFLIPDGPIALPSVFSYRGGLARRNDGVDVGLRWQPLARNEISLQYSFLTDYRSDDVPPESMNAGPDHRFSIGWNGWRDRVFYSASYTYTGSTYWTDVLDERYWGAIPAYSLIDGTLGYSFGDGAGEVALRGTNLANKGTLQHIFGDVIKRKIVAEVTLNLR